MLSPAVKLAKANAQIESLKQSLKRENPHIRQNASKRQKSVLESLMPAGAKRGEGLLVDFDGFAAVGFGFGFCGGFRGLLLLFGAFAVFDVVGGLLGGRVSSVHL